MSSLDDVYNKLINNADFNFLISYYAPLLYFSNGLNTVKFTDIWSADPAQKENMLRNFITDCVAKGNQSISTYLNNGTLRLRGITLAANIVINTLYFSICAYCLYKHIHNHPVNGRFAAHSSGVISKFDSAQFIITDGQISYSVELVFSDHQTIVEGKVKDLNASTEFTIRLYKLENNQRTLIVADKIPLKDASSFICTELAKL